jgi:hypothetical protein
MTASTWTRVYRRPDGGLELWELRHRSGALLAEMSLWQVNRTRWYCDHRDVLLLLEGPFAVTRAIVQHRRELRALRAQIHARVADFDAQDEPPTTEASAASFAEEVNAERGGLVQSLRRRRRERRERRRDLQTVEDLIKVAVLGSAMTIDEFAGLDRALNEAMRTVL